MPTLDFFKGTLVFGKQLEYQTFTIILGTNLMPSRGIKNQSPFFLQFRLILK